MSISSNYYPLTQNINNFDDYNKTHKYHSKFIENLTPEMFVITPKNNNLKLPGNYFNDNNYCLVKSSNYNRINGCSDKINNIYNNHKPDIIDKITDKSFTSSIFNQKYIQPNKNDIIDLQGIESNNFYKLKDYEKVNNIDFIDDLDEKDLKKDYCSNEYKKYFYPSPSE